MPAEFYQFLHIVGAIVVFFALGGGIAASMNGGGKNKLFSILHGVGVLLLLVAGFGNLAKLGIGFPMWVQIKIVLWLLVAALPMLIKRMPDKATLLWASSLAIGVFAVFLAVYKPF
jgi:hypothetical protein